MGANGSLARRRKAPILTKNELLAMRAEQEQEQEQGAAHGCPGVGQHAMRGRQSSVLTNLEGLNDEQEMEANDVPMLELQYNVQLLADEAKADITRLDGQVLWEKEKVASLVQEKEKLSTQDACIAKMLAAGAGDDCRRTRAGPGG